MKVKRSHFLQGRGGGRWESTISKKRERKNEERE